jgi:hypothetical protein
MTPDESAQPAAKRAKYTAYTLAEKIWLLDFSEQNPKVNAKDFGKALAAEVNAKVQEHERRSPPSKNTVNGWKKMREKLKEQNEKEFAQGTVDKTRVKADMHGQMEEALYVWFRQMQARDMALTDDILCGKGMQLGPRFEVSATFGYSPGWLQTFKHRYSIKSYVLHGKAGSANQEGIGLAHRNLRLLLQEGGYEAENVYNRDESGAFWRQMPTHTLATGNCAGSKKEKERATFSLCCNATGTQKMGLFVIGKAVRPCSFPKSFQPKRDLNVQYAHNTTASMTAAEYGSWVRGINSEMKRCVL